MVANNINKNTSDKNPQPERKGGFKASEKPGDFPFRALRACERATLESSKGHSRIATVPLLQARLGPFRLVFGHKYMSIKFKPLIVCVLGQSQKSLIYIQRIVR